MQKIFFIPIFTKSIIATSRIKYLITKYSNWENLGWFFKPNNMKTAMQELIDDLKELKKDSKERNQDTSFDIGLTFAIARAELRLKKEKEQIKDAFKYGWNWNYDAEKYYNETYTK